MIICNVIEEINKYWWYTTRTKPFVTKYRIIEVEKEFNGGCNIYSFIERIIYKPDDIHDIFDSVYKCKELFTIGHDTRKFNSGTFGWWRMDLDSLDVYRKTFERQYGYNFNTLLSKCISNIYFRSNDIYFSKMLCQTV